MKAKNAVLAAPEAVSAGRMAEVNFHITSPEGAILASLRGLVQRVPGALGATVSASNGLTIASTFPDQNEVRLAGALAAMIARAAHGTLDGMGPDRFVSAVLEGSVHVVFVCDVSEGDGCLLLIVERTGDLEGARRELVRTAIEITTVLDLDVG